jgi:hypothetical protein
MTLEVDGVRHTDAEEVLDTHEKSILLRLLFKNKLRQYWQRIRIIACVQNEFHHHNVVALVVRRRAT